MNLPVIDLDVLSGGSGAGGLGFKFTATNYADLLTKLGMAEGDLGIVYNSQGVWLVNRKLKGIYIYQSGAWEYANQELQDRLAAKIDSVNSGFMINVDNADSLNPIVNFQPIPFFSGVAIIAQSTSSTIPQSYNTTTWNGLDDSKTYVVSGVVICGCSATNRSVVVSIESGGVNQYPESYEKEPKDTDDRYYFSFEFDKNPVSGSIDAETLFNRTAGAGGSVATMYFSSLNIRLKY